MITHNKDQLLSSSTNGTLVNHTQKLHKQVLFFAVWTVLVWLPKLTTAISAV